MRFTINQSNVPTWAGAGTTLAAPLRLTITTTSVPIWRY